MTVQHKGGQTKNKRRRKAVEELLDGIIVVKRLPFLTPKAYTFSVEIVIFYKSLFIVRNFDLYSEDGRERFVLL